MWHQLLTRLQRGDVQALARSISLVEAESDGYENFLQSLPHRTHTKIIGVTGPPGAGKSTVVDALIGEIVSEEKRVAVLCVDPSSPFNLGAVLGDRIRMSNWYTHPNVFIRSLATRGSMGGLHPKIIELTDVVKTADYDYVIVETVGVGQSEIEIAGLADTTVVVLVPEAGDEVQTMKAGLMEIADVFVVNKADRPGADVFVKALRQMLAPAFRHGEAEVPVVKTVASQGKGISDLYAAVKAHQSGVVQSRHKIWLLAERAYQLIQRQRMQAVSKAGLQRRLAQALQEPDFNLYRFVKYNGNETEWR